MLAFPGGSDVPVFCFLCCAEVEGSCSPKRANSVEVSAAKGQACSRATVSRKHPGSPLFIGGGLVEAPVDQLMSTRGRVVVLL